MFRKTFFVKPQLQLKYLFFPILWTFVSTGIVYLVLNHILFTSERLETLSTFEIEWVQRSFRLSFIWVTLLLMIAFGIESMLRFHRLIGPIYVIEKMVNTIAEGDLTQDFKLRKRDELKDLVTELLVMKDRLKSFVLADRKTCQSIEQKLSQLSKAIEQGASPQTLKNEIQAIQKELTTLTSHFKV